MQINCNLNKYKRQKPPPIGQGFLPIDQLVKCLHTLHYFFFFAAVFFLTVFFTVFLTVFLAAVFFAAVFFFAGMNNHPLTGDIPIYIVERKQNFVKKKYCLRRGDLD
jgi:hypothetical protein